MDLVQQDQIASPLSLRESTHEYFIQFNDPYPDYVWHLGYGVTLTVDNDKNVVIKGANNLKFDVDDTIEIKAKHHAIVEADRVDLNPDRDDFDFLQHVRKLRRNGTTSL